MGSSKHMLARRSTSVCIELIQSLKAQHREKKNSLKPLLALSWREWSNYLIIFVIIDNMVIMIIIIIFMSFSSVVAVLFSYSNWLFHVVQSYFILPFQEELFFWLRPCTCLRASRQIPTPGPATHTKIVKHKVNHITVCSVQNALAVIEDEACAGERWG